MKFAFWVLLLIVAPTMGAELPVSRHAFTVIAHRGDHSHAHENTLTSIENAIRAGADYVELDVRRTVDGQYVLMHDGTVDRMTDGHGPVSKLTLQQLQSFHVRDRRRPQIPEDHIPTFNEALSAIKGRVNLYLDFKEGDRREVTKAIREAGVTNQVLVYDGIEAVAEWRRVAPELPLIVSLPDKVNTPEQLASFVSKFGVEVLDGPWKDYSAEMVSAAHKTKARIWPDIQTAQEDSSYFEKIMSLGFTGVQTDHPEELISWLTAQSRR
jgi:glycerophosphoryl diester phosphodiesterase